MTSATEKCDACYNILQVIYYQRRAADEPPDKIVFCSNCPLDTNRLHFSTASKLVIQSTKKVLGTKNASSKSRVSLSSVLSKVDTRVYITVRGNAAVKCYRNIMHTQNKPKSIVGVPVNINTDTKCIASYYYLNSSTQDEVHITSNSDTIAPFIVRKNVDIYSCTHDLDKYIDNSDKCILGHEYQLPTIEHSTYTVLRTLHDGQKPHIVIAVRNSSDSKILSILESILAEYGTELSIKSIVSSTILNRLYIQSGRAFDWPSAPNNGYTYAWKPDGERFWYLKYGSIWLFSRRLLSGRIAGWNMCTSLHTYTTIGPVLDVEVMIGFDPILIDILIGYNEELMSVSRTIDYVLDEYNSIKDSGIIDVPIHVREYYRSEQELLSTKDTLQYPVDGVVGIEDGSMNIIKLKDEKSIELQLQENGDLVTSDREVVANSNLQETEQIGSIVEIRFVKQSGKDTPTITETFVRTDKTKANDLQACKNIFSAISSSPDSLARRNVVQWCNSIRLKLNQIASKTTGKGRVILDIGAGDGQAVSDYSSDPEVTYLLLEPNEKKCRSMIRRLQDLDKTSARLFKQPSDVMNALRLLIPKKIKYAVLCATLEDILSQKECIRTLKTCVRCCIASLSISYIVPELQKLAIEGLNVIGFGYMYDSVNDKGELVNEHGVTMKYTSYQPNSISTDAVVQWGTDKAYIEPVITLQDFKEVFYYKLARNIIPTIADSKMTLLNTVADKVYIIASDKYII